MVKTLPLASLQKNTCDAAPSQKQLITRSVFLVLNSKFRKTLWADEEFKILKLKWRQTVLLQSVLGAD